MRGQVLLLLLCAEHTSTPDRDAQRVRELCVADVAGQPMERRPRVNTLPTVDVDR
jgi:hypothetical protein